MERDSGLSKEKGLNKWLSCNLIMYAFNHNTAAFCGLKHLNDMHNAEQSKLVTKYERFCTKDHRRSANYVQFGDWQNPMGVFQLRFVIKAARVCVVIPRIMTLKNLFRDWNTDFSV